MAGKIRKASFMSFMLELIWKGPRSSHYPSSHANQVIGFLNKEIMARERLDAAGW